MPDAPGDEFKQAAAALGGRLKTFAALSMRKAADTLTSSNPSPRDGSPSGPTSGSSSNATPARMDENHASSSSSPSTESESSSLRRVRVDNKGFWIDGRYVPAIAPGVEMIDGVMVTNASFQLPGMFPLPAGSRFSEVLKNFDRWSKTDDGKSFYRMSLEDQMAYGPYTGAQNRPSAAAVTKFFEKEQRWHAEWADRTAEMEGAYVAGEAGKAAIFVKGRKVTEEYEDPAEAIAAYERYVHDPDRAFETVEDVAESIVLSRDDLVDLADRYIASLHCSMWMDWNVADPKRRIIAARWLADTITGMEKFDADEQGRW